MSAPMSAPGAGGGGGGGKASPSSISMSSSAAACPFLLGSATQASLALWTFYVGVEYLRQALSDVSWVSVKPCLPLAFIRGCGSPFPHLGLAADKIAMMIHRLLCSTVLPNIPICCSLQFPLGKQCSIQHVEMSASQPAM